MIYGLISGIAFLILISFIRSRQGYLRSQEEYDNKKKRKQGIDYKFSVGIFIFAILLVLYGVFTN